MRVTDPKATITVKHPSDSAEFDISVAMPREDRARLSRELQALFPETGLPDATQVQAFYEKIVRGNLRALRGVEDSSGNPLDCSEMDKVVKSLREIRLPDCDNVALWLGQEIYAENVLSEDDKKKLKSALSTKSGSEPTT